VVFVGDDDCWTEANDCGEPEDGFRLTAADLTGDCDDPAESLRHEALGVGRPASGLVTDDAEPSEPRYERSAEILSWLLSMAGVRDSFMLPQPAALFKESLCTLCTSTLEARESKL